MKLQTERRRKAARRDQLVNKAKLLAMKATRYKTKVSKENLSFNKVCPEE